MSYKGDSTMEIKVRRKKRHQKYVRRRRLFFATLGLLLIIIFIFCFAKGKASKHANAGATHLKAGNKTVATKVVSKYAQYLVAIDAGHGEATLVHMDSGFGKRMFLSTSAKGSMQFYKAEELKHL